MAKSQVVKEGWYYIGTYLEGEYGDAHRKAEERSSKCTLLAPHFTLRKGPSGKLNVARNLHALEYPDEQAMLDDIEARGMKELPPEADGNPLYVPAEFDPDGIAVGMLEAL